MGRHLFYDHKLSKALIVSLCRSPGVFRFFRSNHVWSPTLSLGTGIRCLSACLVCAFLLKVLGGTHEGGGFVLVLKVYLRFCVMLLYRRFEDVHLSFRLS